MMNLTRRNATTGGLSWLGATAERTLLVLANCCPAPPELVFHFIRAGDEKKKRSVAWLDLLHVPPDWGGVPSDLDEALAVDLLVIDGMHGTVDVIALEAATWATNRRQDAGKRTILVSDLLPDDIGRWLVHKGHTQPEPFLERLADPARSFVIDARRSRST